jgi:hypothetical protein
MGAAAICAAFGLIKIQRHADVTAQPVGEATAAETRAEPSIDLPPMTPVSTATTAMSMTVANATPMGPPPQAPKATKPKATALHAKPQGLDHVKLVR